MEEEKDLSSVLEEMDHAPEVPAPDDPPPKSSSGYFIGAVFCFFFSIMCFGGGFIDTAPMGLFLIAIGMILVCLGLGSHFSD